MRRVEAELEHGRLAGCPEFALKSKDRFKEKLAKEIQRNPDEESEKLAASIHDAVRYTREISTRVPRPPGWDEIANYRREGW